MIREGKKSTTAPNPGPSDPDRERPSFRRRAPRKKGKKIIRAGDSPAPTSGAVLEERWNASQFKVPEAEGKTRFHDFGFPDPLLHAISDLGFEYCTPIQAEILPTVLSGSDVTGKAQTGTGKSAAFLLNIYTHLLNKPIKGKRPVGTPRVLIIAPTRELVLQIEKDARDIGKYTHVQIQSILGGMQYDKQKQVLIKKPIDIMVDRKSVV